MTDQHKPLTAAVEELHDAMRRWSDSNRGTPMIALTLESAQVLLSMLTPPTDADVREAENGPPDLVCAEVFFSDVNALGGFSPYAIKAMADILLSYVRAVQADSTARGEADAMLAAMFGECSMCGHGPGCGKDCDGYDHWVPKHDASPESVELLKRLRIADVGKLSAALRAVQQPRLTEEQIEAVVEAVQQLEAYAGCAQMRSNGEARGSVTANKLRSAFPALFGKEGNHGS